MAEHRFRKAGVVGSNPTVGFAKSPANGRLGAGQPLRLSYPIALIAAC